MGLFDGDTEFIAYASSSGLVEDDNFERLRRLMLLDAIRHGNSIPAALVTATVTGMPYRGKRYLDYGRDRYARGLPEATFTGYGVNRRALETVIQSVYGPGAAIYTAFLGTYQPRFYAEARLRANYETRVVELAEDPTKLPDPLPDWLPYPFQHEIYLPTTIDPDLGIITGGYYDNFFYLGPVTNNRSVIYFLVEQGSGIDENDPIVTIPYRFDEVVFPADDIYYQVRVRLPDGTIEYFFYLMGAGDYPSLDEPFGKVVSSAEYFPVAVLITEQRKYLDESEDIRETTEGLLKQLRMNAEDILEDMLEQEIAEGADIKRTDFFIHFAAPVKTVHPATWKYQYFYWTSLLGFSSSLLQDFLAHIRSFIEMPCIDENAAGPCGEFTIPLNYSEIEVKEATYKGYNVQFRWLFIEHTSKNGLIAPDVRPEDSKVIIGNIFRSPGELLDFMSEDDLREIQAWARNKYSPILYPFGIEYLVCYWQEQVSPTPIYRATLVFGLEMAHQVNTGGGTKRVIIPLDGTGDENFIVPLHVGSFDQLDYEEQEELLQDSIYGTVYLVDKIEIPWYQSTFFKILTVIVTFVIIVYAPYILEGWLNALGSLAAGILGEIVTLLYKFILSFVVSWVAQNSIGGTAGTLFSIVLGIVTAGGGSFVDFKNMFTGVFKDPTFFSALRFLEGVGSIFKTGYNFYLQAELKDIEEELRDAYTSYEEELEALENAYYDFTRNQLNVSAWSVMRRPGDLVTENPATFYDRKLEANPGARALAMVPEFYNMALTLPRHPGDEGLVGNMFDMIHER